MRKVLNQSQLADSAIRAIENFHTPYVSEVESAIQANKIVVVGMAQNPVVKKARKLLTEAKLDHKYIEYGGYMSKWKERLALKLWSGWPTFPMVFIEGKLIGGCDELTKWFEQKKS